MNNLIDESLFIKNEYENSFSYTLVDNDLFSMTEYKILQNKRNDNFIECQKVNYNGKIQLFYLCDGLITFENYLLTSNDQQIEKILSELLASVLKIQKNGFLYCHNIDLLPHHIFVEPSKLQIKFTYIPTKGTSYKDLYYFEDSLKQMLVSMLNKSGKLINNRILDDLKNKSFSLIQIYQHIKTGTFETHIPKEKRIIKLVSINSLVHTEIIINKNEFILGKKQELVDGAISYNKMISRVHCKIIKDNHKLMIMDLNSSNGTYVNQIKLQPQKLYSVKNGDYIRLANSNFKLVIDGGK